MSSTLELPATPEEIRSAGQQIRKTLYWEKKDLANYVTVAKLLLQTAHRNMLAGGDTAQAYGARALGLSYDIASFTWPGWDEDGIEITEDLSQIGLEAAQFNVDFCENYPVPEEVKSRAYFILGAHHISTRHYDAAIAAWETSSNFGDDAGARGLRVWIEMAKVLKGGPASRFEELLSELEGTDGQLKQTAAQIRRAFVVFGRGA